MDFHVTIDFFDDLTFAERDWDEQALRSLVAGFAERGVTAIHWLDYGGKRDGGWVAGSYFDAQGRGVRFINAVPDPLAVVCDEAHRHGMKLFSVLKVGDLAFGLTAAHYPLGHGPNPPVGLPHIGGHGSFALRWLRENPQFRMRLHPSLIPDDSGKPIRTIRIWHENSDPTTISKTHAPEALGALLEIWVSDDNATYRKYDGPITVHHEVRRRRPPVFAPAPEKAFGAEGEFFCIELADLIIPQPFVCVAPREPIALANQLEALVEVEDTDGKPVATTFGFTAVQPYGEAGHDWKTEGIAFDTSRRTQFRGRRHSAGRDRVSLDEQLRPSPTNRLAAGARADDAEFILLGLGRGRNEYLTQPVDFTHVEARQWLLGMMEHALDVGADGIDIRFGSHTETLDWENYGFAEPTMAEFRRRHGVDPACEPFDRQKWLELRGEYTDTFVAEASELVRKRGGQLYAHVIEIMDPPAEWGPGIALQNQIWNWRQWLTQGLLDGLTLKGCKPEHAFFSTGMDICRRLNVPTLLCPKPRGGEARESSWIEMIDQAEAGGVDHFNLYESRHVAQLQADGSIAYLYPQLWRRIAGR